MTQIHHTIPGGMYMYRYHNNGPEVVQLQFIVFRLTSKGVWIRDMDSKVRFVLTTPGHRRYAHKDKREALNAFIQRKQSEIGWIKYDLRRFWPDYKAKAKRYRLNQKVIHARLKSRQEYVPRALVQAMEMLIEGDKR